ncbi:MAG: hypothetical protein IJO11_01790 [Alphaproteobacteria bacterium]|nr:hypothetical protein [Alphaproteobacteria bacterium]
MICCRKSNIVGSYCCASVTEDGQCCDWGGNCCPADKPLRGTDGKCYSCDDPGIITMADTTTCSKVCPNRFNNTGTQKKCILCGVKGTIYAGKPMFDNVGNCYSCDYEKGFDMGATSGTAVCQVFVKTVILLIICVIQNVQMIRH